MQLKYGTTRAVLLLPFLGIAVKFARIRLWSRIAETWSYRKELGWPGLCTFLASMHKELGLWHWIADGVYDNLSERRFWKKSRNSLAWPTYFSLCGLLNVQKIGLPLSDDLGLEILRRAYSVAGQEVIRDSHTFENQENFCRGENGMLYILDYASSSIQALLTKHEKRLREIL